MSQDRWCSHCWVWAARHLDFIGEDGKAIKGDYLHKRCYHCGKMGQILAPYDPEVHSGLASQSVEACKRMHMYKCPSKDVAHNRKKKQGDYDDDF